MRLLPLFLLFGCGEHYKWEPRFPPSEHIEWRVVPWEQVPNYCAVSGGYTKLVACATQIQQTKRCFIHSYLTQEQAKVSFDLDGMTIFDHEMKHCEGWRHQ